MNEVYLCIFLGISEPSSSFVACPYLHTLCAVACCGLYWFFYILFSKKNIWIFSANSKSEALFGQSDSHCETSLVLFHQYRLETPDLCTSLLGLCSFSCVLRELFRWQPGLFSPQVVISWGRDIDNLLFGDFLNCNFSFLWSDGGCPKLSKVMRTLCGTMKMVQYS